MKALHPTESEKVLLRKYKKISPLQKMIDINGPAQVISSLMGYTSISQRRMNQLLGVSSTAYVTNVLKGRKRLTLIAAVNLANICGMNKIQRVTLYESLVEQELP